MTFITFSLIRLNKKKNEPEIRCCLFVLKCGRISVQHQIPTQWAICSFLPLRSSATGELDAQFNMLHTRGIRIRIHFIVVVCDFFCLSLSLIFFSLVRLSFVSNPNRVLLE